MTVRPSREDDLPAVHAIYAHHVLTGLASFEEAPPDLPEPARRRAEVLARGLPWLVAEAEGAVAGYAYAGPYRARPAYRFTVENSVYVAPAMAGRGLGRALLTQLLALCEAAGCRQVVAIIGDSANAASVGLHRSCGFRDVGILRAVGFKHGRWVDTVLMQRALSLGDATLPG